MRLYELLKGAEYFTVQGSSTVEPVNIRVDSRLVSEGDVFIGLKGTRSNGTEFASEAIAKGARAIIVPCEAEIKEKYVTIIKVKDTRKTLAIMAANFFHHPDRKLITIGVTGTKGKTSTAYIIREILNKSGVKCGLISTVERDTGKNKRESTLTTPESLDIFSDLNEMVKNNCKAVVMEVSSQGLKKKRVYGISFDVGIFTNLYEDHIGPFEHENMKEYYFWKTTLFRNCKVAVINEDDPYGKILGEKLKIPVFYFGEGVKSSLSAKNIRSFNHNGKLGMAFTLNGVYNIDLQLNVIGKFSIYNIMAACLTCNVLGIFEKQIASGIGEFNIPGRGEIIVTPWKSTVVIDYAHNGAALEEMLKALRLHTKGELICVFGCGGDRAKGRRWAMGEASGTYADYTIITSDNPRNECPFAIIDDIIKGIRRTKGRFTSCKSRKEAIFRALVLSREGDIVLIAGRGHEKYQTIKDKKIFFCDVKQVTESIEKVKNEQSNSKRNN